MGRQATIAYHSPPAPPSPLLLGSWVLPAAADAKLEGSGVGIMEGRLLGKTKILLKTTEYETVSRESFCGGCALCDANGDATQDKRGRRKCWCCGMTAETLVNQGRFVMREMQNASARRTRSRREIEFRFRLGLDGAKMI